MRRIRDEKIDSSRLPDGGWGWMVVLGVAVTNMFNQSLVSVFGLLFGEYLEQMGHGTAGISLVANINNMVTCFSGLIMGPILKKYSCRKVSLCGALMTSVGLILASYSDTITEIIIFYSICTGLGLGLILPSTFVVVKDYFSTKRGRAVGLSMVGTGLGQMLMPQLVGLLLNDFGFAWTTRIIGVLCLHGAVGSLLFQPVKWHLKPDVKDAVVTEKLIKEIEVLIETNEDTKPEKVANEKVEVTQKDISVKYKYDTKSMEHPTFLQSFTRSLDVNMLKDPVFVNICIGLSMVYTAGMAFGMIVPFFLLEEIRLSRDDTALCMSVLSGADIVARLTLPSITHFLNITNRTTFLWGALLLAGARALVVIQTTRGAILVTCVLCGYIRAITVINQNLTVSDYCTDEQLPAALGWSMVSKGLFVISLGQLLGWIRDYTKSFVLFVQATNILLLVVFVTWSIELVLSRFKRVVKP